MSNSRDLIDQISCRIEVQLPNVKTLTTDRLIAILAHSAGCNGGDVPVYLAGETDPYLVTHCQRIERVYLALQPKRAVVIF